MSTLGNLDQKYYRPIHIQNQKAYILTLLILGK